MTSEHDEEIPNFPKALSLQGTDPVVSVNLAIDWIIGHTHKDQELLVVRPRKYPHLLSRYPQLERLLKYRNVIDSTTRTAPHDHAGPVLLVWPTPEILNRFSNSWQVTALAVTEWVTETTNPWVAAYRPEILNGSLKVELNLEPIVMVAIESIGVSANLNNRFVSRDDKDEAVNGLKSLISRGHKLDPDAVYAYTLSLGWPGDAIDEFLKILKKMQSGVQVRSSFRFDTYDYWVTKTEAAYPQGEN